MHTLRRPRFSLSTALLTLALAGTFAAGCGGTQHVASGACATPKEGMSASQWDQWAACVENRESKPVDDCRGAFVFAQSMTPAALEAATRCTLGASLASDGAVIGDALNRVQTNDGRVEAIARGLAPHYTNARYGSSLATSLNAGSERALGFHFGVIEEPARTELIRTAFGWGLRALAEASLPWITNPEILAEHAEVLGSSAGGRRDITDVDRFALVATGQWGAEQIIRCAEGRHRACPDNADASFLRLLQHDTRADHTTVGTSRVMEQLQRTQTDPEISALLLDWLAAPTTPNRDAMIRSLRNNVASHTAPIEMRTSIAQGANAALCDTEEFNRARGIQAAGSDAPTAPWLIFLERCAASVWTLEDLLRIYGHGRAIYASPAVLETMDARVVDATAGASCAQTKALADQVAQWHVDRIPTMPTVYAELHRLLPACQSVLQPEIARIAQDTAAAPEARFASIVELARSGDRAQCRQIARIPTTTTVEGDTIRLIGAEFRKEEATAACR